MPGGYLLPLMKRLFLVAALVSLVGSLSMLTLHAQQPQAGTIEVTIEGPKVKKGQLMASIYNSEANFMKQPYRTVTLPVEPGKDLVLAFNNIPTGTYALAVFHDENNNNELDTNWMGIPREGYGFSNNVRPTFRPANFEESQFTHTGQTMSLTVKVH